MNNNDFTLPPQTTCAKCGREIESDVQDKFRYRVIEVRDLLTDEIRYYHHSCYVNNHKSTNMKGR